MEMEGSGWRLRWAPPRRRRGASAPASRGGVEGARGGGSGRALRGGVEGLRCGDGVWRLGLGGMATVQAGEGVVA